MPRPGLQINCIKVLNIYPQYDPITKTGSYGASYSVGYIGSNNTFVPIADANKQTAVISIVGTDTVDVIYQNLAGLMAQQEGLTFPPNGTDTLLL